MCVIRSLLWEKNDVIVVLDFGLRSDHFDLMFFALDVCDQHVFPFLMKKMFLLVICSMFFREKENTRYNW